MPVEKAEIGIVASDDAGYDESGNMRALFVAAPRDVARSRAETLEMAGLSLVSAELESFALLRALRESEGAPNVLWRGQSVAYVQLGHRASSLCVLQDTHLAVCARHRVGRGAAYPGACRSDRVRRGGSAGSEGERRFRHRGERRVSLAGGGQYPPHRSVYTGTGSPAP